MPGQFEWTAADDALLHAVRALGGPDSEWKASHEEIIQLRRRLLTLQKWTCAYCRSPIEADMVGYRELDHVLPEVDNPGCDPAAGRSDELAHRRKTFGYPHFMYEPRNLVITCKMCNSGKTQFDCLRTRAHRPAEPVHYPTEADLTWVHPLYHHYEDHIDKADGPVYTGLTDNGRYLIHACGLDKAVMLAQRAASRAASDAARSIGLKIALNNFAQGIIQGHYDKATAVGDLVVRGMAAPAAGELLDRWMASIQDAATAPQQVAAEQAFQAAAAQIGHTFRQAVPL